MGPVHQQQPQQLQEEHCWSPDKPLSSLKTEWFVPKVNHTPRPTPVWAVTKWSLRASLWLPMAGCPLAQEPFVATHLCGSLPVFCGLWFYFGLAWCFVFSRQGFLV